MQELSRRNQHFTDSVIRRMTRVSLDCGAINLAQGFPDFDPPKAMTDRLAEAIAEYLHEKVRKEYWGYAPDESLSISDLYKVKYQGIRPAVGYPSLPDQLLNYTLDKLLDMSQIGVRLTENGAMYPTATVSGIYIAHPESQYFMIGNIDVEQMKDYARRRNLSETEVRKLLNKNIS